MTDTTSLGDRMKAYERHETGRLFMKGSPIVARMDGRAFHTFTGGMEKPFDVAFMDTMKKVTSELVQMTNADIGYTQSDEITLIWKNDDIHAELMFGNKKFKWHSILAAMTTTRFNHWGYSLGTDTKPQMFDARVFQVPSLFEASNILVWREQDAVRNSVQMLAQSLYSHTVLQGKNASELQDMCWDSGHNWNDLSSDKKRGTYFQRKLVERMFTVHEIAKLPEKHQARLNPELKVERHDVLELDIEILTTYEVDDRIKILFGDTRD